MDLRLLQANLNHCAETQDLLTQTLVQWGVSVTVTAEPYYVHDRPNWLQSSPVIVLRNFNAKSVL